VNEHSQGFFFCPESSGTPQYVPEQDGDHREVIGIYTEKQEENRRFLSEREAAGYVYRF
jgi:hypothetical protein